MSSSPPSQSTCDQVGREKESSPAFDLTHMNLFMLPATVEVFKRPAEDDVPERHRRRRDGAPREKPAGKPAVTLDRPLTDLPLASREACQARGEESSGRGRRRPKVNQCSFDRWLHGRFRRSKRVEVDESLRMEFNGRVTDNGGRPPGAET